FQLKQAGLNTVLLLQALVLDLQKEIVFAKNVAVSGCRGASGIIFFFRQKFRDFAFKATGEADESFGMLRQKPLAHPWLVVETMQRRFRSNLGQIAVAFLVFRQHQEMIVSVALGRGALDVMVFFLADVELAADDRLDAGVF